jgi:ArsR family transcriptional regulator, virulence genes transcriptional regulator
MLPNIEKARLFASLANEFRLDILSIIIEREASVNELSAILGKSQSSVSQHLGKLRQENLVTTRRDAQSVYYSCQDSRVFRTLAVLDNMRGNDLVNGMAVSELLRSA